MQENSFLLTNRHLQDLNPLIAGTHDCDPDYGIQPAIRKYTLIHYVFRGKGTLFTPAGSFPVKAGEAFLIRQGEVAHYRADPEEPWYYCWIGFDGTLSAQFDTLPPVFTPDGQPFQNIIKAAEKPDSAEYLMSAELFRLYASLFNRQPRSNRHVQQVKNYIRLSYMYPIRVDAISKKLNLDRRYLARLFKEQTGISIQQFLMNTRMEEADRRLQEGYSVKESAHMAGYDDISNFSKLYKKHFGRSPALRRKDSST